MGIKIEEFERAKEASTFQLLFKAARLVNEWVLEELRDHPGLEDIKPSHTLLFPHIDSEGTRITEIAQKLGVSKQAIQQLVDDLEGMGAIERLPDPSDGRAKLVKFKPGMMLDGLQHLQRMEDLMRESIPASEIDALHLALRRIIAYVSSHDHSKY